MSETMGSPQMTPEEKREYTNALVEHSLTFSLIVNRENIKKYGFCGLCGTYKTHINECSKCTTSIESIEEGFKLANLQKRGTRK